MLPGNAPPALPKHGLLASLAGSKSGTALPLPKPPDIKPPIPGAPPAKGAPESKGSGPPGAAHTLKPPEAKPATTPKAPELKAPEAKPPAAADAPVDERGLPPPQVQIDLAPGEALWLPIRVLPLQRPNFGQRGPLHRFRITGAVITDKGNLYPQSVAGQISVAPVVRPSIIF